MSDCNTCLEDKSKVFVGIVNSNSFPVEFAIESLEESFIGFCPEHDSSAVETEKGISTCFLGRDPCLSPSSELRNIEVENEEALYTVELEDGTIFEDKTFLEINAELYKKGILFCTEVKNNYTADCDQYSQLPPDLTIYDDLDYSEDRKWALYINNEYIGSTDSIYDYMEDMDNIYEGLRIAYDSGHLYFENQTEEYLAIKLVANTTLNIREEFSVSDETSFIFDPEEAVLYFCLGVYL